LANVVSATELQEKPVTKISGAKKRRGGHVSTFKRRISKLFPGREKQAMANFGYLIARAPRGDSVPGSKLIAAPVLQCMISSYDYDDDSKVGWLIMGDHQCCDMNACVEFFLQLDSEVRLIHTYAGKECDTTFKRLGRQWISIYRGAPRWRSKFLSTIGKASNRGLGLS
jgi:hypothetical protein